LHTPQLGEEENRRLYGKCNNPYGHGHNYVVDVTVRGPVDARSGRVVDPARLDQLVWDQVIGPFDRRNLNVEVARFQDTVPTSENLGLEIWRRLEEKWASVFPEQGVRLAGVRIAETPRNIFQVTDDESE
jgi:6-pyruvoyltetrahydropterin/6-carboxytetrahydropterin synthase